MNERARILAIETDPEVEYVHTLKAPRLVDGRVEYEEVKQKSGDVIRQPKQDFIGRHICLGSFDLLAKNGKDTKACPVCKEAESSSIVDPAQRRFAMHVIRYQLQPGSFNVSDPFGVSLIAWCFTDKVFNLITDLATEWGDLRNHDLKLGPCTKPKFQQFDIQITQEAAWQGSEDRKKITAETYKANTCPDLSRLIGRKLTLDQVEQDLDRVRQANREAYGTRDFEPTVFETAKPSPAPSAPASEPLESASAEASVARPPRTDVIDFNDLLKGL